MAGLDHGEELMRPVSESRSFWQIVPVVLVALGLAGCAGRGNSGDTPAPTGTATANGIVSTGLAQPSTELVRVSGTVVEGGEPGCLLLDTGFTRYILIGGDQAALASSEESEEQITVTGHAHSATPTPCTGGVPLEIDSATPAT
jgi:hypothetical protein